MPNCIPRLLGSLLLLGLASCDAPPGIPPSTANTAPASRAPAISSSLKIKTTAPSEESDIQPAPDDLQVALDAPKPEPYAIQKTSLAEFFNASPDVVATLLGPPLNPPATPIDSSTLDYSPTSFEPDFPNPTFFKSLSVRYDQGTVASINLFLRLPMPTRNGQEMDTLELTSLFFKGLFTDPMPTYTALNSAALHNWGRSQG